MKIPSYEEFLSLFNFVKNSETLKIHLNKSDKKLGKKFVSSQQRLVNYIREDVYEIVVLMAKQASSAKESIAIIEKAKSSPMISEDFSNFTFFKLNGTAESRKLSRLRSHYLAQIEIMATPATPGIGTNWG